MKPILIHTHFHKRRTGVTRSIENVLPFFKERFETYLFGYGVNGNHLSKKEFRKTIFSNKEIVVHCHRNNEMIRMLIYRAFGAKFTLIATRHAETKPSNLTLKLLKSADKVITLIQSMSANLGVKNTVVGHGVNINDFKPKSNVKIDAIGQQNIILCAGRVRKTKGQAVLLEAAKILKNHQNWALAIVGKVDKPEFLKELKAIAKKHKIENQVYFIAETPNIIAYYQASKIAVVPSFSEGFSLVTAEAMACGCAVIATKNVGVHNSLISPEKNGYLTKAGNINELQVTLEKAILGELPILGQAARAEIIQNWSAKQEAEKLMEVYTLPQKK